MTILMCDKVPYNTITNPLTYNFTKGMLFAIILIITFHLL